MKRYDDSGFANLPRHHCLAELPLWSADLCDVQGAQRRCGASGTAFQRKARSSGFVSLEAVFTEARQGDARLLAFVTPAAVDLALGPVGVGGGVSAAFETPESFQRERLGRLLLPAFRGPDR